jgi:peptidoglycan/LPS O-acetylase OafA/YrhL
MGEFVPDSLIAQLYVQLRSSKPSSLANALGTAGFIVAAASMLVVSYYLYSPDAGPNFLRKMYLNFALGPSAALLIFCAARCRNIFATWLTSRPLLAPGDASYSIYMVHYMVLMVTTKLIGSSPHGVVFNSVAIVLSTIAILAV